MAYEKILFKNNATPEDITLFVTNKCNLKCKHCFYWRELNNNKQELNLNEIEKIAHSMNKFRYLALTGGEPFLRDDLTHIVKSFSNKVKNISISTNGTFTDTILEKTENILKINKKINVAVIVSIDHLKEKHDEIRGVKGTFDKAVLTIKKLNELKKSYSHLNISVSMTFMSQNQDEIHKIYEYVLSLNPNSISIVLIRGNSKEDKCKKIDISKYTNICNRLCDDLDSNKLSGYNGFFLSYFINNMKRELYKLTSRIYKENKYICPCYAGQLSGVIYPNGDVYPCELLNKKIGNLRDVDYNFNKLWFSKNKKEIVKFIKESKCFCIHGCNLMCAILFNKKYLLKIMLKKRR